MFHSAYMLVATAHATKYKDDSLLQIYLFRFSHCTKMLKTKMLFGTSSQDPPNFNLAFTLLSLFVPTKHHCKKILCTPIHFITIIVVCTIKVITSIQKSSLKSFSLVGNQFCTFKEALQCKTEFEMYFIALLMFILQN